MLVSTEEMIISPNPDRLLLLVQGLRGPRARNIANQAVREARRKMPRATGHSANRLFPLYGQGYFGIGFLDTYVWYLENGIRPFTMYGLEGKTIPMWVKDPDGIERAKNPKIKTRVNLNGITEVLIFRKVAQQGERKDVMVREGGQNMKRSVPRSYPGAPGRIGTPRGAKGRIAGGNVGVRWRHPGLEPRKFLNNAITLAAQWNGILPIRLYVADRGWKSRF